MAAGSAPRQRGHADRECRVYAGRTPRQAFCRNPVRSGCIASRRDRACAWTAAFAKATRSRSGLRPAHREADRERRVARDGTAPPRAVPSAEPRSSASGPACPSCSRWCGIPTIRVRRRLDTGLAQIAEIERLVSGAGPWTRSLAVGAVASRGVSCRTFRSSQRRHGICGRPQRMAELMTDPKAIRAPKRWPDVHGAACLGNGLLDAG